MDARVLSMDKLFPWHFPFRYLPKSQVWKGESADLHVHFLDWPLLTVFYWSHAGMSRSSFALWMNYVYTHSIKFSPKTRKAQNHGIPSTTPTDGLTHIHRCRLHFRLLHRRRIALWFFSETSLYLCLSFFLSLPLFFSFHFIYSPTRHYANSVPFSFTHLHLSEIYARDTSR